MMKATFVLLVLDAQTPASLELRRHRFRIHWQAAPQPWTEDPFVLLSIIALPVLAFQIVFIGNPGPSQVESPQPIVIEVPKQAPETSFVCDIPPECGCCGDFATSPPGFIGINDVVVFSRHLGENTNSPNWDPCMDVGGSPGFIDASDLATLAGRLCGTCPAVSKP